MQLDHTGIRPERSRDAELGAQATIELLPGLFEVWLNACSFWRPDRIVDSAWIEHAPFAFWLIGALRPKTLVELGTQGGYSYFSFCQAVDRLGLDTRCFAIDTWQGDDHAGFYGEEVFDEVDRYNQRRYSAFSNLVRSTFSEAAPNFSDRSVDLLHIDGRHFYADVKEDFETWRGKLSDASVVLFHDINVRDRDFGVYRLWEELQQLYPFFTFVHGHGLGVLGTGPNLPPAVRSLLTEDNRKTEIRDAYARLGAAITAELSNEHLANERDQAKALADKHRSGAEATEKAKAETERLRKERDRLQSARASASNLVRQQMRVIGHLQREAGNHLKRNAELKKAQDKEKKAYEAGLAKLKQEKTVSPDMELKLAKLKQQKMDLQEELNSLKMQNKMLQRQVSEFEGSSSWRITRPLRAVSGWLRRTRP
jgi:O-antigen biosynthesis protein